MVFFGLRTCWLKLTVLGRVNENKLERRKMEQSGWNKMTDLICRFTGIILVSHPGAEGGGYRSSCYWRRNYYPLFCRCILACHIDFLSAGHMPPRLKANLEDTRKKEQSSIIIHKCDVCKKYFSNQFQFEIHNCGTMTRGSNSAFSQTQRLTQV